MVNAGRFIRGNFPAPGDGPDWINCPPLTSPAIPVLNGPKLERRPGLGNRPPALLPAPLIGQDQHLRRARLQRVRYTEN